MESTPYRTQSRVTTTTRRASWVLRQTRSPLTSTVLFASPEHQGQWATRTVNGNQEWGTFSTPLVMFGSSVYQYRQEVIGDPVSDKL